MFNFFVFVTVLKFEFFFFFYWFKGFFFFDAMIQLFRLKLDKNKTTEF